MVRRIVSSASVAADESTPGQIKFGVLAPGVPFTFRNPIADADPGPGNLRLNNATLASVTQIFVDNMTVAGDSVTAWLDTFDDGGSSGDRGVITLMTTDGAALFVARVTGSVADGTGYRKINVTPLITAGSLVDGVEVAVQFSRAGTVGVNGVDGVSAGLPFTFDTTTAMADPGVGKFRLNNATLASVTAAAFDDQSAASGNPDVSAAVLSWDDSSGTNRGTLLIKDVAAPQNFALYIVAGASVDNVGWTQLALTHVASAGSFTNGNPCSVEFSPAANAASFSATSRVLGRATAGAGPAEELTLSQVLDFIGSAARGDILYRGASAWQRLAAGAAQQFLQTGGAGADPAWATAGWVRIGGVVASGASSIDFTNLSSAYSAFAIVLSSIVPASAGANLYLRTDENNGASFDAGATDYTYSYVVVPDDLGTYTNQRSAGAAQIQMSDTIGNSGDQNLGGIIYIFNPSGSRGCLVNWNNARVDNTGKFRNDVGGGWRNAVTTAVNAVRLLMSTGNISGNATLYGIPL